MTDHISCLIRVLSGTGRRTPGRSKPQHSSCGNIATRDVLAVDAASVLEDDVFNSPPSATSRRRRMAAAVAAARAGASTSPAAGAWMRPRLGSSVAGASTSPPQISLRDIKKVTSSRRQDVCRRTLISHNRGARTASDVAATIAATPSFVQLSRRSLRR